MSSITTPYSYTFYSHYNCSTSTAPNQSSSQARHSPSARDNVTSSYSYSKQELSRLEPPQSSYLKPPSDRSPNIRVNSPKRSSPSGYENYKSNFNYSSNKPGTRSPFDEMKRSFDDLKRSSVELREPVKYP